MLTHGRLLELLTYDPETGIFRWRVCLTWRRPVGSEAGSPSTHGYYAIGIDGIKYYTHRLAWFYVYGTWPVGIDHKDRVKNHNWISNLREADDQQNQANAPVQQRNKTGFKGVVKKRQKWQARLKHCGKSYYFGVWDTPEEAHAAYCEAARKLFGEYHAP